MNTYITQKNSLCAAALGAMALALLPSCQDEDFGYTAEQIKYAKSFTEKYGEIAPDKNWDLSTYGIHYGDDAGAGTRGAGQLGDKLSGYYDNEVAEADKQFVKKGWWEVPKNTLTWMEKALAEGKDNRYLGSNFILQLPANDFVIVPIFQGHSGINSELEVKINGYKITKVWGRSEDILVNDRTMTESQAASLPGASAITQSDIKTTNNTYNISTGKYEADNKWHTLGYYTGVTNPSHADQESNGRGVEYNDGITDYVYPTYPCYMEWAHRVMSKPIYFRKDKISSGNPYMYLSLHNIGKQIIKHDNGVELMWDYNIWLDDRGPNVWTTVGNRLTSINPAKRMLALNIPTASRPNKDALPKIHEGQGNDYREPSQVMIIACEDADGVASDNDVNDVAFLIIGYPNVPTVIPTEEVIKKRYMCEDLGATDDFDFNDIVVDVTQKMQYQLVTSPAGMEDYNFNEGLNNDDVTGVEIASMQPMPETRVQTAKITHVCGTLPIQVKVGNYMFPKIDDPTDQYGTRNALKADGHLVTGTKATRASGEKTGWNPNEEKVITDNSWDPAANNITIYVDWSKSECPTNKSINAGKVGNTNNPYAQGTTEFADFAEGNKVWVGFPRPGDVPYIIATDQDVPWMRERQDIPQAWVDSRADITARNGNEADPGYGMYMENYNGGNGTRQEVAIWTGSVTGMAGTTGVVLEPGSAEVLGIAAAGDGYTDPDELATGTNQIERHLYKILKVYTEPMSNGQKGAVGLCYVDENGNWVPLTTQQPDAYYQGAVENSGYGYGVEGLCCTEIFLTDEQYNIIVGNSGRTGKGLVVTSQTDRLVIRKIAMDRDMSGGFIVNIDKTTNGTIKAIGQRERIVDSKADAGDEASRCSIPYDQARYKTGSTFTLTAIGKKGWALKNWYVNNVALSETEAEHVFTCIDGTDARTRNIRVEFEEALDPGLFFRPYPYDQWKTSIDLRIANGSTFKQRLSSYTWDKTISTYGHNADIVTLSVGDNTNFDGNWYHILNIFGKEVGTTEFVVYMKDCYMGETRYGVSEELKAKIQVVEVPNAERDLTVNDFYAWNILAGGAHITGEGDDCNKLGEEVRPTSEGYCSTVLGNTGNVNLQYADLNGSDYMTINVAAGYEGPRLFFNKGSVAAIDFVVSDPNCQYTTYVNCDDGSISYIVDLKAVRAAANAKNSGWYCSVLNCITCDYSHSTKVNWIRLDKYNSDAVDAWKANNGPQTLTLSCADSDYTLYINGVQTTSAQVNGGSTVKIKAVTANTSSKDHYRMMWTGANGIEETADGIEASFTMPKVATTITATPLYAVMPIGKIQNGTDSEGRPTYQDNYNGSYGSIIMTCGERKTDSQTIFVQAGAEITASVTPKPGYAYKECLYIGTQNDPMSIKVTRTSDDKKIQYAPQVVFAEPGVTYTPENGSMGQSGDFDLTSYKPSNINQNGLGLLFDNTNIGTINVCYRKAPTSWDWLYLQSNIVVNDGYVVIKLSSEDIKKLQESGVDKFFVQAIAKDGTSIQGATLTKVYGFML